MNKLDTVWLPILLLLLMTETILFSGINNELFAGMNTVFRLLPDVAWEHITLLGDALVALALLSLLAFRFPQLLPAGLLAAVITTLLVRSLKPLMAIERPLLALGEQVHVIGVDLHNFSLPSGHTATAFALAGVYALVLQRERLTGLLFTLALLVGFSRIAVGAHWPMDIFLGAAIGWFSAWAGWVLSTGWAWDHSRSGMTFLSLLFLLFALLLFWLDSGYPQAIWLQYGIGALATLACMATLWVTWRKSTADVPA